jgi:hypothetical protein
MAGAKKRKQGQIGIQEGKTAMRTLRRNMRNKARVQEHITRLKKKP